MIFTSYCTKFLRAENQPCVLGRVFTTNDYNQGVRVSLQDFLASNGCANSNVAHGLDHKRRFRRASFASSCHHRTMGSRRLQNAGMKSHIINILLHFSFQLSINLSYSLSVFVPLPTFAPLQLYSSLRLTRTYIRTLVYTPHLLPHLVYNPLPTFTNSLPHFYPHRQLNALAYFSSFATPPPLSLQTQDQLFAPLRT